MAAPPEKLTRPPLAIVWDRAVQNMQGLLNAQTLLALVLLLGYPLFDAVPQEVLFKIRHHISAQTGAAPQGHGIDRTTQRPTTPSTRAAASPRVLSPSRTDRTGKTTSGSDFVFITLDDAYAEQHRYPLVTPRGYLDSLVRAVTEHHPRVIALDFKFSTADLRDPDYARLCEGLHDASRRGITVVLPTAVQRDQDWYRVLPFPPVSLRSLSLLGYANLRGQPVENADLTRPMGPTGARMPSFALAALMGYLQPDEIARARSTAQPPADAAASRASPSTNLNASCMSEGSPGTSIGGLWQKVTPETMDAALNQVTRGRRVVPINYRGPVRAGSMSVHSAETLFRVPGAIDPLVRDKLVLIGATFEDPEGQDTFVTPFGDMRGAEVHATVLHSLLDGDRLYVISGLTGVIFCLALGLITVFLAFRCRFQMVLATIGVAAMYAGTCIGLFTFGSTLLPVGPGLAVTGVTGLLLHKATHLWYPCARTHVRFRCSFRDAWQTMKHQITGISTGKVVPTDTQAPASNADGTASAKDMSASMQSNRSPSSEVPFIDPATKRSAPPLSQLQRGEAPTGDGDPR